MQAINFNSIYQKVIICLKAFYINSIDEHKSSINLHIFYLYFILFIHPLFHYQIQINFFMHSPLIQYKFK